MEFERKATPVEKVLVLLSHADRRLSLLPISQCRFSFESRAGYYGRS